MAYKIIWSPKAKKTFYNVISYLEFAWGEKQITNFVNRTDQKLDLIKENPYLFRKSEIGDIHRVLITKHNLLLYQIHEKTKIVELISFWDTRQDPKKFKNK